jgi:hypothetical protein
VPKNLTALHAAGGIVSIGIYLRDESFECFAAADGSRLWA